MDTGVIDFFLTVIQGGVMYLQLKHIVTDGLRKDHVYPFAEDLSDSSTKHDIYREREISHHLLL